MELFEVDDMRIKVESETHENTDLISQCGREYQGSPERINSSEISIFPEHVDYFLTIQKNMNEESDDLQEYDEDPLEGLGHLSMEMDGSNFPTAAIIETERKQIPADKNQYKSETCETTLSNSDLNKHKHKFCQNDITDKPHECETCGKGFAKLIYLKRHQVCHTGLKPHKCNVCEKMFTRSTELKRHIQLLHTKSYKCNLCDKGFATKQTFSIHMWQHEGRGPYKCNVCRNNFSTYQTLDKHMLCHTGERPFECGVCGKSFRQKSNMKAHQVSHTGDKKFKCNICDKRFTNNSHLVRHTKNLHEDK